MFTYCDLNTWDVVRFLEVAKHLTAALVILLRFFGSLSITTSQVLSIRVYKQGGLYYVSLLAWTNYDQRESK